MVKLLVADDEEKICQLLHMFFSERGYQVLVAHNGPAALECIRSERPHLVFLDLQMPGLNGLEILKETRQIDETIKVIIITSIEDDGVIKKARDFGATDYVIKPFSLEYLKEEVLSKVSASLYEDLRKVNDELKVSLANLKNVVRGIVAAFSAVISKIDPHFTHDHVVRSVEYATKILEKLRGESRLQINEADEEVLLAGILLHDIGKIFTPKEILYKPGPLTDEEWDVMRRHPVDGADILDRIDGLKEMARNVRHHHERYDGGGYPAGLKGEQIPIGARIASVVDAFDAMISDRPYRKAMSIEKAIEELLRCRGTQFDPQVVDAVVELCREQKIKPHHVPHLDSASPGHSHAHPHASDH
jgi:putative nucleotidyltransferase with HDIG domain